MTFVTFSRIRFTASSFSFLDGVVTFYSDGNEGCWVFFFKFFCLHSWTGLLLFGLDGNQRSSNDRFFVRPSDHFSFFFTMANSMEESLFHDGSFVI